MINTHKFLSLEKKNSKNIFNFLLFIYLIFGLLLSVNTGVSTDAFIEELIWKNNLEAAKDVFGYDNNGYSNLLQKHEKYYGVGYNFLSQIYLFFASVLFKFDGLSDEISKVILKHGFIFLTFFFSGLIAKKIVNLIIKDEFYSNIFLILFLFYPYLLGHGFYNPKDIPFLFAWLLCTYISFKIFFKIYYRENISTFNILLFSLSTSFLLSIRISGVLIFIQYIITFIIISNILKKSFFEMIKHYLGKISLFCIAFLLLLIIFYPIFWKNPLLIYDSIFEAKNIQYGVCTLTMGKCMDSLDLPPSYIFIWLFFKLPLITLIGFSLFPLVEKKIFSQSTNQILLGSILLTLLSIILLLIFFKVNLYDELRHILFLVPLFLISGFSIIYFFSRNLTLYLTLISVFIFLIQNIYMYPYNYTWFNPINNFVDTNKKFELDYWGISGRNIAKKINSNEKLLSMKDKCIYVAPVHIIKHFISDEYECVKPFFSIYPKSEERYILIKFTRNLRRENPSKCKLIFEESYKLNVLSKKLKMGEVYICD